MEAYSGAAEDFKSNTARDVEKDGQPAMVPRRGLLPNVEERLEHREFDVGARHTCLPHGGGQIDLQVWTPTIGLRDSHRGEIPSAVLAVALDHSDRGPADSRSGRTNFDSIQLESVGNLGRVLLVIIRSGMSMKMNIFRGLGGRL